MRTLSWIFWCILFLAAMGFAAKNSDSVTVYYYLGTQWNAPLVFVITTFFCAGVVVGAILMLGFLFRQRREISSLKRELKFKTQDVKGG